MNPDGTVNWAYVFTTLSVRLVAIFILLGILQIGITVASKIISRFFPVKQK
jgi:hypothetical protein